MNTQMVTTLNDLKDNLESASFLVSKAGAEKETHSHILKALYLVADIENQLANKTPKQPPVSDVESEEVGKVSRKLKLWAKRPEQINTRILNAYLTLERSGEKHITEFMIQCLVPDIGLPFMPNFMQMRNFGEKNHGKIFEIYGNQVKLWEPIIPYVREYEELVFQQ
jgi:hypothetical protein